MWRERKKRWRKSQIEQEKERGEEKLSGKGRKICGGEGRNVEGRARMNRKRRKDRGSCQEREEKDMEGKGEMLEEEPE